MDFQLRAAQEKLEREQRERKARAKSKMEREKQAKAEAARQREAIEAAQRAKRLDAARAQLEAERQMEESMLLGNGIIFSQTLEALSFDGFGDKIKLPPSCFRELSDQGALDKGPMYFRLSMIIDESVPSDYDIDLQTGHRHRHRHRHRVTHSGVLEFTAKEGSVELPPHVWNNLLSGVSLDVPLVEVHYVSLPKGTYAKLQPLGMGFSDVPNHKAVLETSLRRHATLSEGDIVAVSYGELNYRLKVLELKPSSTVSVLETDIEVDIEGPDSATKSIDKEHALTPLVVGKIEGGIVEEGEVNYYKFFIEDAMSDKIASGEIDIEIKIDADVGDGDTNVYVSRHPMILPTRHRHEWSSHEMGSKALIIRPKDPSLVAGTYSIGIFGYKGVTRYQISVAYKDNLKQKVVGECTTVPLQVDVESVECRNCKHYISNRTILLHEAYCIRHNVLCRYNGCGAVLKKEEAANHVHCDKCGQAFRHSQLEKHMRVFHEPLHCPCGVILEKEQMVEHQSLACPLRSITCRFCGDMVRAGNAPADARDRLRGLCEHESICGSRTAPCDSCGRSIMLKEMDLHVVAVHQKS